jgi:hypothetical protein
MGADRAAYAGGRAFGPAARHRVERRGGRDLVYCAEGREFWASPQKRCRAAQVRLIVWCKACQHQVEPDPAEMAARYAAGFDLAIAAPSNPISRQLRKPLPTPRASRAISRYQTLIWPGAGGGKVSRAVGPLVDRLRSTRPNKTLLFAISLVRTCAPTVHLTRSRSANVELVSVK